MSIVKKPAVVMLVISIAVIAVVVLGLVFASSSSLFGSQFSRSSGTIAILFIDPANTPSGVSAVYLGYNDVAIHPTNTTGGSSWQDLKGSGVLNLESLSSNMETIAAANVPLGTFDAVRFNVTSSLITYQGSNYTAQLLGASSVVSIPLNTEVQVLGGETYFVVIDFIPKFSSSSSSGNNNPFRPEFNLSASARAYSIPSNDLQGSPLKPGDKIDVSSATWWDNIRDEYSINIESAKLTPTSFSITIQNSGTNAISVENVEVTTFSSFSGSLGSFPAGALSASFKVDPDGSLSLVSQPSTTNYSSNVFVIQPGSSVTLTFSGHILLSGSSGSGNSESIISGNSYLLSVWGAGVVESGYVTATQ